MNDLPPSIKAQRAIEDRAARLGAARRDLERKLDANQQQIVRLLVDAEGTGVALDQIASLVHVSRQTLYRWRKP